MPSCHLPFRFLFRSRSSIGLGRAGLLWARWPIRKYTTAPANDRRDETASRAALDLIHNYSPDAVYSDARDSLQTSPVPDELTGEKESPYKRVSQWVLEFNARLRRRRRTPTSWGSTNTHLMNPHSDSEAAKDTKDVLQTIGKGELDFLKDPSNLELLTLPLEKWESIALWLLDNDPGKLMVLLRYAQTEPSLPRQHVHSVLGCLSLYYTRPIGKDYRRHIKALVDLFDVLIRRTQAFAKGPSDTRYFVVWGTSYRNILHSDGLDEKDALQLYRTIKHHRALPSGMTLLHFATYFARNGYYEQAIDALKQAAKDPLTEPDSFAFRSTCTTLLRRSVRQAGGLRASLRLVDSIVDMGVTLNIQLCTVLMLNAVEEGDIKTAVSIYDSLVQQGLQPDKYTFSILFKGCKVALDDKELLNMVIRDTIATKGVLDDEVVTFEMLHCLALHHFKNNPGTAFDTVSEAFVQLIDTGPLEKLGILRPGSTHRNVSPRQKLPCRPQHFGVMLAVYLENLEQTGRLDLAAPLYERYKELANAGIEPFASTLETDYIPNSFMMTFIKRQKTLLHAAQVVKDMQKTSEEGSRQRCKPTVITWSIFLHGFTKHGQMRLAEQVLDHMRNQGVEPNEVTWDTLLGGHALNQDVDNVIDTIRRMEADGHTWSAHTIGNVRRLRDQAKFQAEWQKARQSPQYDFTADIKEELGTKMAATEDVEVQESSAVKQ